MKIKSFLEVKSFLRVHSTQSQSTVPDEDRAFSTRLPEIRYSQVSQHWERSHSCFLGPPGTSQNPFRLNEHRSLLQAMALGQTPQRKIDNVAINHIVA